MNQNGSVCFEQDRLNQASDCSMCSCMASFRLSSLYRVCQQRKSTRTHSAVFPSVRNLPIR
jgi:hypothetical protein